VAGPKSREVLEGCVLDSDIVSNESLPFMGVIETGLKDDIPCRIARISFSGEMAYEVYVPSDFAEAMMDMLWDQAQQFDGCLYGLEALGTMRIEKGHVTAAELDGRVSIDDAGLGRMASPNKAYIGSALRQRPELLRDDRPRLVGLKPVKPGETFKAGAILCRPEWISGIGEGWVTAVTQSPALGHWIGLGFISGGHDAWSGKTAVAADPLRGSEVEVEIISPHMYDPDGERMHG
jgi:sarcosine oxidase subunit alpha